jgi:hypothetical protein
VSRVKDDGGDFVGHGASCLVGKIREQHARLGDDGARPVGVGHPDGLAVVWAEPLVEVVDRPHDRERPVRPADDALDLIPFLRRVGPGIGERGRNRLAEFEQHLADVEPGAGTERVKHDAALGAVRVADAKKVPLLPCSRIAVPIAFVCAVSGSDAEVEPPFLARLF